MVLVLNKYKTSQILIHSVQNLKMENVSHVLQVLILGKMGFVWHLIRIVPLFRDKMDIV